MICSRSIKLSDHPFLFILLHNKYWALIIAYRHQSNQLFLWTSEIIKIINKKSLYHNYDASNYASITCNASK
jgi:hypothetical protein